MTLALLLTLTPAPQLPANFLLTEPDARRKPNLEEGYTISDKLTAPLTLNPCLHRRPTDRDRQAARTITHWTSAPSGSSEQLILYRTPRAAHSALARLRADAKRCARKSDPAEPRLKIQWRTSKAKAGDEGFYDPGRLTKNARKMAAKVCGLPGVC
ncbi:hypothetical protein [Nonomuraea monospora]|uniref:hypothetical protein n=1 Tax=Nonomuraea monospora TaxID=568818 RepID=UPI0031E23466